MKEVHVKCRHCAGHGSVLHPQLTQCLGLVAQRGWVHTIKIASQMGISGEHAANLTARLMRLGFVQRRKALRVGRPGGRGGFEWSIR